MFKRTRKQSDFNAEVEAHIALEADRLKEQGLNEIEAQAAARRPPRLRQSRPGPGTLL